MSAAVAGVAIGMAVAQNTTLEVGLGRAVSALAVLVAVLVSTVLSAPPKGGSSAGRFASFVSGQTTPAPEDSEAHHVIFKHARLRMPEIERRAADFFELMKMRRTIRHPAPPRARACRTSPLASLCWSSFPPPPALGCRPPSAR